MPLVTESSGPAIEALAAAIREAADPRETVEAWPAACLRRCGEAGVFRWFIPCELGGLGWTEREQIEGYLRLAEADLTTAFVITQRMGACRRIADSERSAARVRWLEDLLSGRRFATVGISHLTTSRRHLRQPVLRATAEPAGYRLQGYAPWVTGGRHANLLVVGASLPDGRQILAAVDTEQAAVVAEDSAALVALSASCTGRVDFHDALVPESMILEGPADEVLRRGGAGTGGLQTSTLAVGLSRAAVGFLQQEASTRPDLRAVADQLFATTASLQDDLLAAAEGEPHCGPEELRARANRLVLRTTQAALTAAKGAGFLADHPVGRWCREALFFLVWSCPQPIAQAHLCEWAGLEE